MHRQFAILLLCLAAMAGCADRGKIGIVALNTQNAEIERIFVATTRQRSDTPYDFNELRTSELTYGRYDMSIPPGHQTGKIEWPKAAPNPATDFVVADAEHFKGPTEFRSSIRTENRNRRKNNEAVIFIHGFNNNFAESLYRFAQVSADMDLQGTTVLYSWPSTESSIEYLHDRDSVLFARDGLQTLIEQLAGAGTRKITLVAHSIGSNLVMETMRQIAISGDRATSRLIDAVVLISPDIDGNLFEMQIRRIGQIPEPFVVFSDDKDIALKISSFLTGSRNRVGQITNSEILQKHGILLINVSDFKDGDGFLNHAVSITSPSVIAIVKKLPTAVELTRENGGNPQNLITKLFKP